MTEDTGLSKAQGASYDDFNPYRLAPSLSSARLSDLRDPEQSWLMDGDHYLDDVDEHTKLNGLQEQYLVQKAEDDYSAAASYWGKHYQLMKTDWDFYSVKEQWTEQAKRARAGRPVLTISMLGKFVKRTVAETKRNPPAVQINPREDGDVLKAEIGMGLVRYIEDINGAKHAYSHAFKCAVVGGLGWIKGGYDPWKKEITIRKVKDAWTYYIDPESDETDGSDARFFVRRYSRTRNGKVQSCYEYWWKERDSGTGEYGVYWAIMEGRRVLDYGHFPGTIIPIFPVYGEDLEFDGERVLKGIVRDLEDPQRFYNYMKSQEAETIALSPKSNVMAEEGTIPKEYRNAWRNRATRPQDILFYRSKNLEGEDAKFRPEVVNGDPKTEWMQAAAQGAVQDLKEVTGIYDTALGSDSRELSGKAIIAKQIASDAGQFDFTENLQATIKQVGRWLLEMIPVVYAGRRRVRILGEDGKVQSVNLDAPMGDNTPASEQVPIENLDFTETDLSVTSGSSYATRREAGVDAFQSIMQAIPNTAMAIADLAVKNMDIPYAREAADRLHALLPQSVRDAEKAPKGFVPASQLQEAMRLFEETKAANVQIQQEQAARITALEAELKNQVQGKIAAERVKGEYGLAQVQIKEMNANEREAMKVQADVEKSSAKIQSDLIREVGARSKAVADAAKPAADRAAGQRQAPSAPATAQEPGPKLTFENPALTRGPTGTEDMLMEL